jgi:hypothetical protein
VTTDRADAPAASSTLKQVLGILLVVIPLFVPEVVIDATPLRPAAAMVIAGVLPVITAWMFAPRLALAAIPLAGLTNGLSVLVFGHTALATVFAVVVAGLLGLSARWGLHTAGLFLAVQPMITIIAGYPTLTFGTETPGRAAHALICAALAMGAGLWTVGIGAVLLRNESTGMPDQVPWPIVGFYATALMAMLGAGTLIASTWLLGSTAGLVLATIVMVTRPTYDESRKMIAERTIGTLIGGFVAAVVAAIVVNVSALVLIGTAAMVVAAVLQLMHARYAWFVAFVTAAIVLFNAPHGNVFHTDVERVVWTVVGVVTVAAVIAIAENVFGRYSDREA